VWVEHPQLPLGVEIADNDEVVFHRVRVVTALHGLQRHGHVWYHVIHLLQYCISISSQ
jgi:hypothetical protein